MISPHLSQLVQQFSVWILPLVLSITLHEAAHGFAALRFGDDTALRMGRISVNPIRHIDPFGTLVLPTLLLFASGGRAAFGWAKPVPVNFNRLKPARLGMAIVGAAGPATNVVLAILSAVLLLALASTTTITEGSSVEWVALNLNNFVEMNLILAVFNMIPIPPLDGGRVAVGLLPWRYAVALQRAERYTIVGLMIAVFVLPFVGINLFGWVVGLPVDYLKHLLYQGIGYQGIGLTS
jgi:Zn-dependent protease